jgi:hypothetical protein
MHRIDSRTYVGQPNETVTLTTQVSSGGQVSVIVDGRDIGAARRFSLPATDGDRVRFQIALGGPLGSTCVVTISPVDGGTDGDFLMCQAHNPAPVNVYWCSVAVAKKKDTKERKKTTTTKAKAKATRGKRGRSGLKKGGGK